MLILSLFIFCGFAAFLSGLIGIGGGIVFVPAFIIITKNFGIDVGDIGHFKFAIVNSFCLVISSSIYGFLEHKKRNNIDFNIFNNLKWFYFFSAMLGGIIFNYIENNFLKNIYIFFLLLVILIKLFNINFSNLKNNKIFYPMCIFNGIISPIVGVGGGIVNVAIIDSKINNIKLSIGTSAAISLMISIGGAIGFFGFNFEKNLINYIDLSFTLVGILSIITIYKYGVKCTMYLPVYITRGILVLTLVIAIIKSYFA